MVEPRWEFFPLLAEQKEPRKWLQIQADLSLAKNTIQAYGKSLEDYLLFCKIYKVIPETAKKADIAIYVRYLSNRPNPRGQNVITLDSGKGLANATMQLRITVIRLFYDHLIEENIRQDNPVGRGKYTPQKGKCFGVKNAKQHISPEWLKWCQRWYETSTLSPRTRDRTYYDVLKVGRWLNHKHPKITSPDQWTRQLAIKFVADTDKMKIGDYVENIHRDCDLEGKPLSPVTKSGFLSGVRRFFRDCQEWEWISRKFSPERALATPRSIQALIKPDPRVISDDIWAKLLWAGLNLTEEDLPKKEMGGYPYPLELVQAVTITWLFAGIRNNEIVRLRTGCVRWQKDNAVIPGTSEVVSKDAICYLNIPVNKTSPGYTKPVDRVLGEAIFTWEKVRPAQSPLIDKKDGSLVDFLFMYRGRKIGQVFINYSIIPMLCKKAGVPTKDAKGNITSHRARSTIATQLSTSKDPMTLFELKEWLGHANVNSTINYTKITPTKLAKSYQDAEYFKRNLRTVEVLIDQDAIATGAATNGEPWKYYDLGHGLCTYDFFSQCKHRMACAGCGFYVPKGSSKAQIIEAKDNLERMLQEIPLTEDEEFAVTEGIEALAKLKEKLADVPTPDGKTPKQIEEEKENA